MSHQYIQAGNSPPPTSPADALKTFEVVVEAQRPRMGMKFHQHEVTAVQEGGWACTNGVAVGDVIYELDGKKFAEMPDAERFKIFKRKRWGVGLMFFRCTSCPETATAPSRAIVVVGAKIACSFCRRKEWAPYLILSPGLRVHN